MTRRSTLKIRKPAQKRSTYIERTRQTSRAAQSLIAAANGHDRHWSHDDIRTALLRRHAVELDDLLAELPPPAITHAVTKGWIHRTAGEPCFRVTSRAAAELKLPARHDGRKIAFADLAKLPKSLPAFDEPKQMPKPVVTEERTAAILSEIVEQRPVLEQAKLYQAVMAETGWVAIEIARRLHTDPIEVSRRWDEVIYHVDLLTLETEYQDAVATGELGLREAYELFRVAPAHRAQLFAAFQAGKSRSAVRKLAQTLGSPK